MWIHVTAEAVSKQRHKFIPRSGDAIGHAMRDGRRSSDGAHAGIHGGVCDGILADALAAALHRADELRVQIFDALLQVIAIRLCEIIAGKAESFVRACLEEFKLHALRLHLHVFIQESKVGADAADLSALRHHDLIGLRGEPIRSGSSHGIGESIHAATARIGKGLDGFRQLADAGHLAARGTNIKREGFDAFVSGRLIDRVLNALGADCSHATFLKG